LSDQASLGPNAAAVVRATEAYNAGDAGGLLEMAHPDIEWEVAREHPPRRPIAASRLFASTTRIGATWFTA